MHANEDHLHYLEVICAIHIVLWLTMSAGLPFAADMATMMHSPNLNYSVL